MTGPRAVTLRTYERGVEDETLACGTGAVAAAILAATRGLVEPPVDVLVRGGETLTIHFTGRGADVAEVYMEGETRLVYEGEKTEEAASRVGFFLQAFLVHFFAQHIFGLAFESDSQLSFRAQCRICFSQRKTDSSDASLPRNDKITAQYFPKKSYECQDAIPRCARVLLRGRGGVLSRRARWSLRTALSGLVSTRAST